MPTKLAVAKIPAWAVALAARHHDRVIAYGGGISYRGHPLPGCRFEAAPGPVGQLVALAVGRAIEGGR